MLNRYCYMFALMLAFVIPSIVLAAPTLEEKKAAAHKALEEFKEKGPVIREFLNKSYGYVIFPTVGEGGFIIGGGHGSGGMVYERGRLIGTASVTQLSVGALIGGQKYRELIFLEDKGTMERFKQGRFELDAKASAIIAQEGIAKDANFTGGMAIFTLPVGGAMANASVGGQVLSFKPLGQ